MFEIFTSFMQAKRWRSIKCSTLGDLSPRNLEDLASVTLFQSRAYNSSKSRVGGRTFGHFILSILR